MKTRTLWVAAIGVAVLAASGVFVASNMGFKVNKTLEGSITNPPGSGISILSLPYNRQVGLDSAGNLFDDINNTFGGSTVGDAPDRILPRRRPE